MKMKDDLQIMGYYKNTTREQIVQIKDFKKDKLWYETIRQHETNPITEFCCSVERFKRLYIKTK
jgi:hypothetical protein